MSGHSAEAAPQPQRSVLDPPAGLGSGSLESLLRHADGRGRLDRLSGQGRRRTKGKTAIVTNGLTETPRMLLDRF